ncbi:ETX/MTX2 family pore-forming toxin [Streptomyces sp. NPDC127084]|uniref:ETX/MTX2 family pore-forming toxin n=1 Tax=Streptomyces sp. NPDC127084 TaxID=3347133 RepID=UPI003669C950
MKNKKIKALAAISVAAVMAVVVTPAYAETPQVTSLASVIHDQAAGTPYEIFFPDPNRINTSGTIQSNTQVDPVGSPETADGDLWFMGTATLVNNTDHEQELSTQAFEKKFSNTVQTTVTRGISTSNKVSGTFDLGSVLKLGDDFSTTVSFSSTDTQASEQSEIYTAPSQTISVPAHTTATVNVSLQSQKATGNLNMSTQLGGYFTSRGVKKGGKSKLPLYEELNDEHQLSQVAFPSGFSLNSMDKTLDFKGAGTYTATYGSNYKMTVSEAPNGSSPHPSTGTSKKYSFRVPLAR